MSTIVNSVDGNNSLDQLELVSENVEPIQILVFPPKNKKFCVDENTNSIQIEPTESNDVLEVSNLTALESNLSPPTAEEIIAEKCQNQTEDCIQNITKTNIKIEEMLKIENPFKGKRCFLKGCKWSPDGFCLLSSSEDNVLRLFEIPESTTTCQDVMPVLMAKEGGTIYDYEWYPKMSSSDPVTCVFASTSQNSPIHLWDAYTGCLRATYQPINQYDEVTAANSLAFSPDGCKLYSGFKKFLRIFDISWPGRVSEERNIKQKGDSVYQTNIVSCIAINPVMPSIYALGSYDRTIGIYTEPKGELQCLLKGHIGGLTHLMFSSDGTLLYSGGRKDSEIICWDLRKPGEILYIFNREVATNQRIYFDLSRNNSHLVTGSTDGRVIIYDTKRLKTYDDTLEPNIEWKAHNDCVNGVDFHPFQPVLASSSGQYHLGDGVSDMEDEVSAGKCDYENSLKIWALHFNREEECA